MNGTLCTETGKIPYDTKAQALAVSAVMRRDKSRKNRVRAQTAFLCKFCYRWHLGRNTKRKRPV